MLLLFKFNQTRHLELVSAGIAGGAALAAAAGQMYANSKMNKRSENYNWRMYETQRKDHLSDWAMQNAYNTPAAQMQRLKQAGLNPNLVYGNGVEGNSSAPVKSADVKSFDPKSPDIGGGVGNAIAAFQNARQMSIQTNMAEKQMAILDQELATKKLEQIAQTLGIQKMTMGNEVMSKTLGYQIDYKKKINEQLDQNILASMQNIDLNTGRYNMEVEKNAQAIENMQEQIRASVAGRNLSLAQMAKIREETKNVVNAGKLQEYEIAMQDVLSNVGGSAPAGMLFKVLMGLLGKFGGK